jgi:hypothetical protein
MTGSTAPRSEFGETTPAPLPADEKTPLEAGGTEGGFPSYTPQNQSATSGLDIGPDPTVAQLRAALRRAKGVAHISDSPLEPGEQPGIFYPFLRGKLAVLLALGLSRQEAAVWAESEDVIISLLIERDEAFAAEVAKGKVFARMYPFIRIYMTSANSWRASDFLGAYLHGREGTADRETMLAYLPKIFDKFRFALYEDEIRGLEFDQTFPIGERDFKREQ